MKPQRFQHPIALALAALVLPASADIIYSGYKDIAIPADFDGVFLNVENGLWNINTGEQEPIAGVTGWDINPFYGGLVVANSPDFQPVRTGILATDAIVNLASGTTVNNGSTFSTFVQLPGGENEGGPGYGVSDGTHLGGGANQFAAGVEGRLGFRLNGTNYGWMGAVFTSNTSGASIRDWAYDNSGGSIVVGRVRQEAPVGLTQLFTLSPQTGESFTLGSAIQDSPGSIVNRVEKTGDGSVTLNTTNTYTGTTLVSAGTLLVNGTLGGPGAGAVTVNSGATLGGDGSVSGAVTAEAGSFVAPSSLLSSIGSLGLSSLDLDGSLLIGWDSLANFDLLDVSGALNLLSGSTLTFSGSPANLTPGSVYVFANYDTLGGVPEFGTVNNLPDGFVIDYDYNGSSIALVPEPSTSLPAMLAAVGFVLRRRRRD